LANQKLTKTLISEWIFFSARSKSLSKSTRAKEQSNVNHDETFYLIFYIILKKRSFVHNLDKREKPLKAADKNKSLNENYKRKLQQVWFQFVQDTFIGNLSVETLIIKIGSGWKSFATSHGELVPA